MRLLLDENLPKKLKEDFAGHEVFSVRDKGWNGIKNGELLKLLIENGFDALLTFDKNLQHQQNFEKYTLTVFVLSAPINRYEEFAPVGVFTNGFTTIGLLVKRPTKAKVLFPAPIAVEILFAASPPLFLHNDKPQKDWNG